jgi:UDP-N-acetylglucosamine/UDP-N-acetylgalactosamine diphosphorylase
MDFQPKSRRQIQRLLDKGVKIPNPQTIDIGDEVQIERISGRDVTIYPGCRIYGSQTVISAGCKLGYEAPQTIENCRLGEDVELKGGFASTSVFLQKSSLGMGAHVREGCLLEEEAHGAHCVGLKQTILFPFVTLGSLINFCDGLLSGGTSRQNHTEVGSSYIHFNFTPEADKSTPSLIGDVPRGVMLDQPPVFLGGQGGMVGPLRLGFGNVVAAGSILRKDYPGDNQLIMEAPHHRGARRYVHRSYPNYRRLVENNILYLANLKALEQWYLFIRKPFFETLEFGILIYQGAMDIIAGAVQERLKRFRAMAEKAALASLPSPQTAAHLGKRAALEKMDDIVDIFQAAIQEDPVAQRREDFLGSFTASLKSDRRDYIDVIRHLTPDLSRKGVQWLQSVVDYYCQRVATVLSFSR